MLYLVLKGDPKGVVEREAVLAGPFESFEEAASVLPNTQYRLVIEWSEGGGPVSIWNRVGTRFECIFEIPLAELERRADRQSQREELPR